MSPDRGKRHGPDAPPAPFTVDARYRALVEHAAVGIVQIAPDGRIIEVNRACSRLLGYAPDEIARLTLADISHPDESDRSLEDMRELLSGERTHIIREKRCRCRSGEFAPVQISMSVLRDAQDRPAAVVAIVADVGELKAAEQRLRQEEERLRLAVAAAGVAVWDWDLRTGSVAWSDEVESILGLAPGSFDGTFEHFITLVLPEDRGAVTASLEAALAGRTATYASEFRIRSDDGRVRWLTDRGRVIRAAGGEPVRMLGVAIDVTAQHEAADRLEAYRQELSAANAALTVVNTIAARLHGTLELEDVLREAVSGMRAFAGAPSVALFLVAGDRMELAHSEGVEAAVFDSGSIGPAVPMSFRDSLSGLAVVTRRVVHAVDLARDERVAPPLRAAAARWGYVSVVSVPILLRDEALGSFSLLFRERVEPDARQRETLLALGHTVGLAVANARQVAQLRAAIVSRERAEAELRSSQSLLRRLATRQQELQETERASIAREIHDEFGQSLTALRIDLGWLGARLPPSANDLRTRVEGMMNLVDAGVRNVRYLATRLRPAMLDDLGLQDAVEWQCQEIAVRTGLPCVLTAPADIAPPVPEVATALFRICQEALTNVIRHARARRIDVFLGRRDDWLVLRVDDDGVGIAASEVQGSGSLGLVGMRERAAALGGRVEIRALDPRGTRVEASFPA